MLDNFARSVQILITLSGNVESQLTNISSQVDKLSGRKISIDTGPVNQLAGAATNAATSITSISDKTKTAERNIVGSFGAIKDSIMDVNAGIGNLITSLAGIAIGGSISGLAWLQSAEAKLYNEQIEEAITNNKKLGFTYDDLKKKVEEQVQAGEGTRQDTEKEFYSTIMAAQKYIGKGPKALNAADAIGDFYFAHQELMAGQGINTPEEMIQRAVRSEGEMGSLFGKKFATAMGIAYEDKAMKSAKSRVKFFVEKGSQVDMGEELAKRPWEQATVALDRLKMDIGDSLATPLAKLTSLFAGLVDTIRKIPGGSALIGWSAVLLTAVSVLGLLNSVLVPGIALLKQMILLTNADTVAKTINILASKALIITDWLGVTSKAARTTATAAAAASTAALTGAIGMEIVALEADTVATTAAATATTGLAAAEWAALSPLLLLALPLIAVAGLLYLAETRTHVFSKALDRLSKTEMSKDLIQWLEDVGYWAGYAIDKLGSVMGAGIETGIINPIVGPIEGLDNLYKNFKSGGVLGVLGLGGGEDSSENNQMLLTSKLFQPISAISGHISTIDETVSWVKGLLGTGWNAINGIYSGIVNFPQNAYKFVVDGIIGFGEWIYNGIVYWATWIYNGILYWADEVQKAYDHIIDSLGLREFSDNFNAYVLGLGNKFTTLVDDVKTTISNLIDNFSTLVDDIKTTITDLVDKFTSFVSDIKTSISNLIPGWMKGSDSGNAASGSEEGFIKFIRETKKGSENYFKYGQLSDETLRAAYREGLTGVPQDHPNMYDTYEYDNIVKNAVPEYTKSIQNNTTLNTTNNINPLGDLGAAADKTLQDDIAKIKEKVDSGEPISSLTPDLGNPSGLAKIAYSGLDNASGGRISSAVDSGKEAVGSAIDTGKEWSGAAQEAVGSGWNAAMDKIGFAKGGFVQKTGFALVHEGEPIIPADVASSSRLQNILESIAYGGSSSNTYGDINVRINYTPPSSSTSSNMIVMDRISFEHMVSDIIAKRLRQLNGY